MLIHVSTLKLQERNRSMRLLNASDLVTIRQSSSLNSHKSSEFLSAENSVNKDVNENLNKCE